MTSERSVTPSSNKPSPPADGARFPKSSRLLRPSDFRRVYDEGIRVTGPHFTLFCLKRAEGAVRIGFTVPRALGKAVQRNRIRRRVREAFRPLLAGLALPADLVVNPRKSAREAPFLDLRKEAQRMLARCGN